MTEIVDTAKTYCSHVLPAEVARVALVAEMQLQSDLASAAATYAPSGFVPPANAVAFAAAVTTAQAAKAASVAAVIVAVGKAKSILKKP